MAETLVLGQMTLHDVPLMRTDLSFLREHLGVEVAGVIGYGLLSRCVVELDLVAPRIALHDPAGYTLAAGAWMPLEFDHLIPTVSASYEGRQGRFHLDIGSNAALTFQEQAVRRFRLLEGRELKDAKLGGVGGFVAAKRGRITSFELAGVRFADLEATFRWKPRVSLPRKAATAASERRCSSPSSSRSTTPARASASGRAAEADRPGQEQCEATATPGPAAHFTRTDVNCSTQTFQACSRVSTFAPRPSSKASLACARGVP